jgi:hypothetical protein
VGDSFRLVPLNACGLWLFSMMSGVPVPFK